jgi:non-ribosomal peptide synthetase component F/thioesterase domain-containing protein
LTPLHDPRELDLSEVGAGSPDGNSHPSPDTYAFPLTPAQERIWQTCKAQPLSTIYNGSFRMNLAGSVEPLILEKSINEIILRHENLRANVEEIDGHPLQVIAASLTVSLKQTDLRTIPGERREAELDRLSLEEAQRTFDLSRDPLIRVGLIRMEDQRYVLTLTIHQIICDGWSIGLIMEELQQLYAAFSQGLSDPLPPICVHFADYVVWQQAMARRPEIEQQLAYWKKKLRRHRRLEIIPDFADADRASTEAQIISHLLPRTLTDRLRDYSNSQGGTFFITTLAAFLAFLHRITGEKDLCVGSPLAGRNRTELESLIGQFVNHVVFRAEIDGDPTFEEFLPQVRDAVWEAFSNQDVPFENVVKSLRPGADVVQDSFFRINFICQREYGRAATFNFDFAGIRMSTMPSKSQGALYDLNFFLVEREAGWRLSLEYRTRLYSAATANALLDNFRRVLEAVAETPQNKLSNLTLENLPPHLQAPTRPVSSGESDVYAMPASPVQERFWLLSQIERSNAAFHMPAIVRISGTLDVPALEKSFQAVIQRHETLRTTFEEIDKEVVQIVSPAKPFTLPVTDLQGILEMQKEERLNVLIREESLKPLDLTSGPLFRAVLFVLGPGDFVLLTNIHHVLADGWSNRILQEDLWSAYSQLANGKPPELPPLPIQYSDYTAWLKEWLDSTDAREHLEFWTKQLEGDLPVVNFPTDRPPTLRPASHGALETLLLPEDLTQALKKLSQSRNSTLFTTLLAGFGTLLARSSNQQDIIVGSPFANRRQETERLIGPFAGPLCLRLDFSGAPTLSEVLTRVNEGNLSALSHAELPFEILVDRVKMRTINGRKPIFQFYFLYQNAFLQPRQEGPLTIVPLPTISLGIPFELQLGMIERKEGIRAQLEYNPDIYDPQSIRHILADYLQILQAFIVQPDVKLDDLEVSRVAQASPAHETLLPRYELVAPSTETEKALAAIWEDVLSTRPIGRDQDYFELGGNSLLATRLFAEIDRVFHIHLPISTLFYAKTIAEFAPLVEKQNTGESWSSLVPIQPNGSRIPFFCVHGGGGNVLIYRGLSRRLGPDQPFYGLQSQGLDGKRDLLQRIEAMAALYVDEIKKVQPHGPYYLGGYCLGGTIALEMAQQLRASGQEVAIVALFDTVNWARLRKRNSIDLLRYHVERIYFHAKNFFLLDFPGKHRFLREKWKVLLSRTVVWKGSLLSRFSANKAVNTSEAHLLARLWKMNDQASLAYIPKPYPGRIADFRPKDQYSLYEEPDVNWNGVVLGALDVHHLPVYPAGMLLEPFVADLAKALRAAIERANADIS